MKSGASTEDVWRVRSYLEDSRARMRAIEDGARFTVQVAPWRQQYVFACGKEREALASMEVDRANLEVESGPPDTRILRVDGERPERMASFTV